MIRTRHLAALAAVVALAYASQASAQSLLQLAYSQAKTFGTVEIAGGAIDITNGAMIVTTSSFGFVPDGYYNGSAQVPYPTERGALGVAEYGDNAIHDAIVEGYNNENGGFWNGTNGIMSTSAQNGPPGQPQYAGLLAVGWVDNSITQYTSFGSGANMITVNPSQSIIASTWLGDPYLNGSNIGAIGADNLSAWVATNQNPAGDNVSTITGGPVDWIDADWNYEGVVASDDLGDWIATNQANPATYPLSWNPQPYFGTVQPASGTAVPEPGTVLLLLGGFGAVLLGSRLARKRRSLSPSYFDSQNQEVSQMSYVAKKTLPMIVALALVSLFAATASANIFVDLQADPSSPDYIASTPRSITFTQSQASDTFILDVYALITPNGGATATPTSEELSQIASNFFVASSSLQGDVSFGSWATSGPGTVNAGGSAEGIQFTTTYGGLGLGGSASTDTTSTHWWAVIPSSVPSGNGTLLPGNVGVEYFVGTIDVSFSAHTLPGTTTSAMMGAVPYYGGASPSTKKYTWIQDGTTTGSVNGSNALVATGSNATTLIDAALGTMSFTFQSSSTGSTPGAAAIAAALGISGPTTLLGGTTSSLTGSVTNSASAGSNALNWGSTVPGSIAISPASGSGLAAQASTSLSGTLTATVAGFGPWVSTATITGTDASTGLAATGSPVAVPVAFTIIGHGTVPTADGLGTPGGPYGQLMSTQGSAAVGYNMAGLTTELGNGNGTIGNSVATILAGTLGASSTGLSEAWRSRSNAELPQNSNVSAGLLPLYSDVVNLTGVTGGSTSIYALQMTYDPSTLGGTASAAAAASNGFLYLGYNTSAGTTSHWVNAVAGNTGTGGQAVADYQGSYAAYTASVGAGYTLAGALGAYGVNTANDTVWAVVDHDAEFAAVPEPGTIALLAAGAAALGIAYRRRKMAKA